MNEGLGMKETQTFVALIIDILKKVDSFYILFVDFFSLKLSLDIL